MFYNSTPEALTVWEPTISNILDLAIGFIVTYFLHDERHLI